MSQDEVASHSCPETVADRVEFIADMMAELKWDGKRSLRLLSEQWGLAESTIRNYSCEASRLITADEETARRDITAGCVKLMRIALEKGDAKGFGIVGKLLAEVSGAKAPEKHQIGTLDAVTPQKAREVMASLFGAVTPDGDKPSGGEGSSRTESGTPTE